VDHHVEREADGRDQQPDVHQARHPADISEEPANRLYH
jgi:hypothetical protein